MRGNLLPPHGLLFPISSKSSFICTIPDRIAHTTAFVTPVVEHWQEREIAQWVHPMKDRSDDPSHHERTLLPQIYISLLVCTEYRTITPTTVRYTGYSLSQTTELLHLQLLGTLIIVCHRVQNYFTYNCQVHWLEFVTEYRTITSTTVRYTGYSMSQSTELLHLQLSGTLVIVCHRVQNYYTYNCQVHWL